MHLKYLFDKCYHMKTQVRLSKYTFNGFQYEKKKKKETLLPNTKDYLSYHQRTYNISGDVRCKF